MNWKLVLFVGFILIFSLVLVLVQQYLNIDFEIINLPQFAPAFAYLVTILLFKNLFISIKISITRVVIVRTLFAIIIPFFIFSIIYFIGKLFKLDLQVNINISLILFGVVIGAIGEEIGWRSFLQPTLEKKYSVIISSMIVGMIWGLWHINHYQNGPLFVLLFLIFTISVSIVIMYLLKNIKYNIIVSSIFHAVINLCFYIFFGNNNVGNINIFIINGIVWLIFAIIIVLFNRKYYIQKQKTSV